MSAPPPPAETVPPTGAWRLDLSKPISTDAPGFKRAGPHPKPPGPLWGGQKAPLPTNAFFENIALGTGANRIALMPYQIVAKDDGLLVGYAAPTVTQAGVFTADVSNWILGAAETLSARALTAQDMLSATMTWQAPAGGSMVTPLVYGMPYATAIYSGGVTPKLGPTPGVALVSVNGKSPPVWPLTVSPSSPAAFSFNSGQTWKLYSSKEVTLTWDGKVMTSAGPFEGWLRVALVPSGSGAADVLDSCANAVPVGGSIEASIDSSGSTATVKFSWTKKGSGPLMTMALPHHVTRGGSSLNVVGGFSHVNVFGRLTAVQGDSWSLSYLLSPVSWTAPRGIEADKREDVRQALMRDKDLELAATAVDMDPYFGGKQLAKLARLVLIAEELGEASIATALRARLAPAVSKWLDGANGNPFVYDSSWGGIVTSKGISDQGADFGQGYYNDHHFHYGYFAYAAAVVAKGDSAWAGKYAAKVKWLLRDIANPSKQDPYFTQFRHMDWFMGHAWAIGLFDLGDNRNQESSSEAVHAWYAVQLFGSAIGDTDIQNIGRLLLAMEIDAAKTYYQVPESSSVYPAPYKSNHVVGNLWSFKVDFGTWFGSNPEFIYGIQMLPFTPVTESLLAKQWVADTSLQIQAAADGTKLEGWRGFMYMAQAVVDPAKAWTKLKSLTIYDDGNTETNTLYWGATRAG